MGRQRQRMKRRQQRRQEESEEESEEEEREKGERDETDGTINIAARARSAYAAALRALTSRLFLSNVPVVVVDQGGS